VSAAPPERLHLLAHRAGIRARNAEGWWGDPLTTSLAAAALARHPRSGRDEAVTVVERLERWRTDERVRPTSADAAALALAARAATDLQKRDPALDADASAAVAAAARRVEAPALHLALASWALDGICPDRDAEPWVSIRARSEPAQGSRGVEEPLAAYVEALAAQRFDAAKLARQLVSRVAASPSVVDGCVLLWLLRASLDRLLPVLPEGDSALELLLEKRSELVDYLAAQLDDETFRQPDDSLLPDYAAVPEYLTSFEALLLDVGLATGSEPAEWLTREEAHTWMGAKEREALGQVEGARSMMARLSALLIGLTGLSLAGNAALGTHAVGASQNLSLWAAVSVAAWACTLCWVVLSLDPKASGLTVDLFVASASFAAIATLVCLDRLLPSPLVTDEGGLIIGVVMSVIAPVGTHLLRTRNPA
jgi:hypothetical protein